MIQIKKLKFFFKIAQIQFAKIYIIPTFNPFYKVEIFSKFLLDYISTYTSLLIICSIVQSINKLTIPGETFYFLFLLPPK